MVLVESLEDLIAFSDQKEITIEEIDLITPGYVNGSSRWMMGPLREIWGSEERGKSHYVYILADGTRYSWRTDNKVSTDLSGMRRVFGI